MNFRQFAAGMVLSCAVTFRAEQEWSSIIAFLFFFVAWLIYGLILNWGKYE